MFSGGNKIKVDKDLLERIKKIAEVAGYASHEEFVHHVLERELAAQRDRSCYEDQDHTEAEERSAEVVAQ